MNAKVKGLLYAVVNILGNVILLGVVPSQYELYALLVFNILQVIYAYVDPTYVFQKLGKKLGRSVNYEDYQ
jgi:hypothetical protein